MRPSYACNSHHWFGYTCGTVAVYRSCCIPFRTNLRAKNANTFSSVSFSGLRLIIEFMSDRSRIPTYPNWYVLPFPILLPHFQKFSDDPCLVKRRCLCVRLFHISLHQHHPSVDISIVHAAKYGAFFWSLVQLGAVASLWTMVSWLLPLVHVSNLVLGVLHLGSSATGSRYNICFVLLFRWVLKANGVVFYPPRVVPADWHWRLSVVPCDSLSSRSSNHLRLGNSCLLSLRLSQKGRRAICQSSGRSPCLSAKVGRENFWYLVRFLWHFLVHRRWLQSRLFGILFAAC